MDSQDSRAGQLCCDIRTELDVREDWWADTARHCDPDDTPAASAGVGIAIVRRHTRAYGADMHAEHTDSGF